MGVVFRRRVHRFRNGGRDGGNDGGGGDCLLEARTRLDYSLFSVLQQLQLLSLERRISFNPICKCFSLSPDQYKVSVFSFENL